MADSMSIDQEYLARRDALGDNGSEKWTVALHPKLKAGLKLLAARSGTKIVHYLERLFIEALTDKEWEFMMRRLRELEQNAAPPTAKKGD